MSFHQRLAELERRLAFRRRHEVADAGYDYDALPVHQLRHVRAIVANQAAGVALTADEQRELDSIPLHRPGSCTCCGGGQFRHRNPAG
ncbi:MAG TPA: hypothetical protein VFE47_17490 [Tepidisphaeraceae bacterium]|nr:hypothetical protein [Tepidisphaeraceae bacterium]